VTEGVLGGSVRIGVLSDTHVPHLAPRVPRRVLDVFQGVDLILHAGDLDEVCALDDLKPLAPVIAVRGNVHLRFATLSSPHLPKAVHLWIKGKHIVLNHGIPYIWRAVVYRTLGFVGQDDVTLNRHLIRDQHHAFPDADVVLFGHSHLAHIERRGKTLFVNPGSPVREKADSQLSVALLTVSTARVEAEIVPL
jgi:putative phosphoesterase